MKTKQRAGGLMAVMLVGLGCVVSVCFGQEEPIWKWPEKKIVAEATRVRAGKDLTPQSWPNGARVAVALSFDFDNETPSLRDNRTSPSLLSQGEYGARSGLPRVLSLLDKYKIPATFFIPSFSARLHPKSVQDILDRKIHEVGAHGWIHERNSLLEEKDERELLKRAVDELTQITGKRPVGIRTPSWDFSNATMKIIQELGFLYDSSLMADERPYEVIYEGKPTGLVELPVEWILDDFPYFWMDRFSTVRPQMTPDEVFSIWKAEFDRALEEGSVFVLTMHPHVIGHRARIAMLERLVLHMKSQKTKDGKPAVWFATHEAVAREAAKQLR